MESIVLRESQHAEDRTLPHDVAVVLADLDVATFKPLANGRWRVENVRKVGVVRVADTQVEIHPKVSVSRLFFMMGYSLNRNYWRNHEISVDKDEALLPALAHSFLTQSARATSRGLLRGYRTMEESAPAVRGRPDIAAQITRRAGLPLPAEITVDEYTIDIPENRMLLSAARLLQTLPGLGARSRIQLRHELSRFDGVTLLAPGAPLPGITYNRLNSHYRPAVELAALILRYASVEHRSGKVVATAYLFDMWRIFEDFLSSTLKSSLERTGGTVDLQRNKEFLDLGNRLELRPDMVWTQNQRVQAVLDAKYKAIKLTNFPNPDVYQILAYCTRFGLSDGHLIYARGQEEPTIHHIQGVDVRIHCHAVNLELHPQDLVASIDELAARISGVSSASLSVVEWAPSQEQGVRSC